MPTTPTNDTARLYEFPRQRLAIGTYGRTTQSLANLRTKRVSAVEFGSGWYHEAAIQEAERIHKR